MAQEAQYNVKIGVGFDSASQARAAAQAEAAVADVMRRMQSATQSSGSSSIISQVQIANLERQLTQAVKSAFSQDITNSAAFKSMSDLSKNFVKDVQPNNVDQSALIATQNRLARARVTREQVDARLGVPFGHDPQVVTTSAGPYIARPYADPTVATLADSSANDRVAAANTAANKARQALIDGIFKQVNDESAARQRESVARLKGSMAIVQATAKRNALTDKALAVEEAANNRDAVARLRSSFGIVQATAKRNAASDKAIATQEAADNAARVAQLRSAFSITQATSKRTAAANKAIAAEEAADNAERVARLRGVFGIVQANAKRTAAEEAANDRAAREERSEQEARGKGILAIEKRTAADERLSRRQGEAEEARALPVSFPTADTSTRVGRAQENVNIAERSLAAVRYRQAEVGREETASAEKVLQTENALSAANRNLDIARTRLRDESIRAGQQSRADRLGGTIGGQFALGFKGVTERPFAEQLGQAFKFSAFYGTAYKILFAITQTFSQTLAEGIAFQQAVTELRIATNRSADSAKDLADQVGADAAQYGFDPAQGVEIAARAQGIYGTTGASKATQDLVGTTSARVVNQIAFASGQQPADIQGNIAAVSQAYGLGFQSQQYIGDLDAYFSHKFGTAPGDTISAVSQAGTVGRAAGFSPAEVSAIAADIMARTGSSPDAAGGYLAQIFSRSGEGSLTALTSKYGIDQNATLSEQFKKLAQVYADNPNQRDDISAAFGRGKVQNAVIALLQDYPEVQKAVAGSSDATGALDDATKKRLGDIGGQLQTLTGSLRLFAKELGESGLLDGLGAAVVLFKDIVDAGTGLLQIFNEIPHVARDVIIGLAALAAASKLAAGAEGAEAATTGVAGLVGRGRNGLAAVTLANLGERAGVYRSAGLLTQSGVGSVIPVGQRVVNVAGRGAVPLNTARGAAAAGAGAVGGLGVAGAAILDALLIQKTRQTSQDFNDARTAYSQFLRSDIDGATSAEELRSRASQAQEVSNQAKDAASGILPRIKNFGADRREALSDKTEADRQVLEANRAARYLESKTANIDSPIISGFDSDEITSSLDAITAAGGTAKTQFQALANAVQASGRAAQVAAANFDPKAIGANNYTALETALSKGGFGIDVTSEPNKLGDLVNASTTGAQLLGLDQPFKSKNLSPGILDNSLKGIDFNKRLTSALGTNGLSSLGDLSDPDKLNSVVADIVGDLPDDIINNSGGKLGFGDYATIQNTLSETVRKYIQSLRDQGTTTGKVITLTHSELDDLTDSVLSTGQAVLAALPQSDFSGRIRQAEATVRTIQRDINSTPGGATPAALERLQAAMNDAAKARYDSLDAQAKTLQQRNGPANTAAGIAADAAIARNFARQEIRSAVKNRSGDVLAEIISTADSTALGYARQAIESARRAALLQAQYDAKSRALAAQMSGAADFTKQGIGGDVDKDTRRAINKQYNDLLNVLDTTPSADDPTSTTASTDTAGQIAAAKAAAEAARKGGGLAAAQSAITGAKATLSEAKKGSVAYYNALASLYQARQQLTDALISYAQNKFLLANDATDPLIQAQASLRAARQKLIADQKRGAGKDVLAEDRVNLQSAQASAESTAFSQRLEAVQTADDLGRISHSKYLNYLQHEHDRLEGIKNRTYQQQEQLNQIDQLMKSAADEMSGQFNFGDIKLPTPYEVRRKIAEEAQTIKNPIGQSGPDPTLGGIGGPLLANVPSNTYITIDGADTAKVRAILTDVLGKRATTTTTSPRHR